MQTQMSDENEEAENMGQLDPFSGADTSQPRARTGTGGGEAWHGEEGRDPVSAG